MKRTFKGDKCTIGELRILDDKGAQIFRCFSLELPWKLNKEGVSCIPPGTYPFRWTVSPRFSRERGVTVSTWEICNVPKRAGIRVHVANYASQLRGCVSPGMDVADINKDGTLDVTSSKAALAAFEKAMGDTSPTTITVV